MKPHGRQYIVDDDNIVDCDGCPHPRHATTVCSTPIQDGEMFERQQYRSLSTIDRRCIVVCPCSYELNEDYDIVDEEGPMTTIFANQDYDVL